MFGTYSKDGLLTQDVNFNFPGKCALNVGDYLYGISNGESFYANEPCVICDDEGKVIIKGMEFDCPNCKGRFVNNATNISIFHFIVRKFKIYHFEYSISDDAYDPKSNFKKVEFSAFSKFNAKNSYSGYQRLQAHFTPQEVFVEKLKSYDDFCALLKEKYGYDVEAAKIRLDYTTVMFKDYRTAVAVADGLNAAEQEKLRLFNEAHRTKYQTDFKLKHDRPHIDNKA